MSSLDTKDVAVPGLKDRFVDLCVRSAPNVTGARRERLEHAPNEFDVLVHRYREKITKLEVIGDVLVVWTMPIVIRGYYIGVLRTELYGITKGHRISNLTMSGNPHPHVSELSADGGMGGHICWGKDELAFSNAMNGGYLYRAQCMVMSTLANVNDDIPVITTYKALNKYPLATELLDGGSS